MGAHLPCCEINWLVKLFTAEKLSLSIDILDHACINITFYINSINASHIRSHLIGLKKKVPTLFLSSLQFDSFTK